MAAGMSDYNSFLKHLLQDTDLQCLDPKDLAPALQIYGVINDAEHEQLTEWIKRRDDRRLYLFGEVLPLKPAREVFQALGKISVDNKLHTLQKLITDFGDKKYLQPIPFGQKPEEPKDERFHEAVKYLKTFYKNECEIMRSHWQRLNAEYAGDFLFSKMYIDLEIIKGDRRGQDKVTSYQDLLGIRDGETPCPRKIIVEGDPGMGKTTYLHMLVLKWALGEGEDGFLLNKAFDLIILIKLGDLGESETLEGFLEGILDPEPASSLLNFALDYKNHDRVLLVLDAYDEMRHNKFFESLIVKRKLGKTTVRNLTLLITTRISHSDTTAMQENDLLLRTQGFLPETVMERFAGKIGNLESLMTGQHGKVDLYRNPLFVGMAAVLGKIPDELYDLMEEFCPKVIERWFKLKPKSEKRAEDQFDKLWEETKNVLGKLAFVTLKQTILHFFFHFQASKTLETHLRMIESEFSDFTGTNLPHQSKGNPLGDQLMVCSEIGLLFPISKSEKRNIPVTNKYRFPHLLFAEFFAAVYAVENGLCKEFIQDRNRSDSFYVEPFSYFMTGHVDASEWRKHVVKECVTNRCGRNTLYCPWMNLSASLPHVTLSVSSIVGINGNNSPNQGKFIEAFLAKYGITPRHPHSIRFKHFTFDSTSSNALCTWLKKYGVIRSEAEGNEDADSAFSKFVAAYYGSNNVKQMCLRHCNLSEAFVKILAEQLRQSKNIKIIDVGATKAIGSVPSFAEALCQSSAEEIDLSECDLTETFVTFLANHLTENKSLRKVDVSSNKSMGSVPAFAEALCQSTAEKVNLSECDLSKTFVTSLVNHLTENKSLKKLDVKWNKAIGSDPSFAAALCSSSIQDVSLGHCDLTEEFTATLSNHLWNNRCLKRLDVQDNTAIGSDTNFAKSLFQSALEMVDLRGRELTYLLTFLTPEFISVFLSCAAEDSNHLKRVNMSEGGIERKQQDKLELLGYVYLSPYY